jgi:hypothetical protein
LVPGCRIGRGMLRPAPEVSIGCLHTG